MYLIAYVVVFVYTIIASFVFHELAHLITLSWYTKNPKIFVCFVNGLIPTIRVEVGTSEQISALSFSQKIIVFASGVLIGLIPILILYPLFPDIPIQLSIILFLWYSVGSYSDLRYIHYLLRRGS